MAPSPGVSPQGCLLSLRCGHDPHLVPTIPWQCAPWPLLYALPNSLSPQALSHCHPMFSHWSVLLPALQVPAPRLRLPHSSPFMVLMPLPPRSTVQSLAPWELTYTHDTPEMLSHTLYNSSLASAFSTGVNGGNRAKGLSAYGQDNCRRELPVFVHQQHPSVGQGT